VEEIPQRKNKNEPSGQFSSFPKGSVTSSSNSISKTQQCLKSWVLGGQLENKISRFPSSTDYTEMEKGMPVLPTLASRSY
jgi:hypothetical protein